MIPSTQAVNYMNLINFDRLTNIMSLLTAYYNAINSIKTEASGIPAGGEIAIRIVNQGDSSMDSGISVSFGSPKKTIEYGYHANEKIRRLHQRRLAGNDDVTSRESADEHTTWGGAIAFSFLDGSTLFISISGYPPHVDEVGARLVAMKMFAVAGIITLPQTNNLRNDHLFSALWHKIKQNEKEYESLIVR